MKTSLQEKNHIFHYTSKKEMQYASLMKTTVYLFIIYLAPTRCVSYNQMYYFVGSSSLQ